MPHLDLAYPRPDIAVLTLNRPEKLNALNHELVEELHAALDGIAANNDCRVVVLTGAGRGFCSGLDLTDPNPSQAGGGTGVPAVRHAVAGADRQPHRKDPPSPAAGDRGGQRSRLRRRDRHRAGVRYPDRLDIGAVLHAIHQARPRRLRHRGQLHAAAHRRRGPGVRPDPDGARRSTPTRRCGSASSRDCRTVGGRRRAGDRRNALQLWQIRRGVDQAGVVGEPRRVEPGGGAARGEPQPDPGVDQRGDARGATEAFRHRQR